MNDIFRLEVDAGSGYYYMDSIDELLSDVEYEYGGIIKEKVRRWALQSKEGDKFHKHGMYIINCGH